MKIGQVWLQKKEYSGLQESIELVKYAGNDKWLVRSDVAYDDKLCLYDGDYIYNNYELIEEA